jgi:hypothetical membrane protein
MSEGIGSRSPGWTAATWARLAVAGIAIYLLLDILLAFLEPQYSLLRDAESDYGVGKFSWVMDLNFLMRCALSLAFVVALAKACRRSNGRQWGIWLLAAWAAGSGLLAFLPDDPPGFPVTTAGKLHLLFATLAFLAVAAGTIVLSWKVRGEAMWRSSRDVLMVIAVVAVFPLLAMPRAHAVSGLCERIFLGLELAWILIAAWPLLGRGGAAPGADALPRVPLTVG